MTTRQQPSSVRMASAESPLGQLLMFLIGIVLLLRMASLLRAISSVVLAILGVFNALFAVLLSILALLKEAFPLPLFGGIVGALLYLRNKDRDALLR